MRRARRAIGALTTLCVLTLCASCPLDDERGHGGRGVLLIAIDSLRADHLSSMGYDRATTPVLDNLAQQGTLFTNAFGVAPEYMSAHAALLTGCDPFLCNRPRMDGPDDAGMERRWWIPEQLPGIAREYLAAGYATAAFVDHPWISPTYGFDRGFQDFYRFREDDVVGYDDFGLEGVVLRFRRWRRSQPADRDWFAYLSITDLDRSWWREAKGVGTDFVPRDELDHVPPVSEASACYFAIPNAAQRPWTRESATLGEYEARYDEMLRLLDKRLGRMLEELAREGRLENTTVCIVGTFGVGFGESGLILDTGTLSDVDLHVPWILRPAAGTSVERGPLRDGLASLLDVAPTLLELSNIELPRGMHGRSQVPVLRGDDDPVREYAFARGGVQQGYAVRDARWTLEHTAPGTRGPVSLRRSWTGRSADVVPPFRDHLRDRDSGSGPGNLEPSVGDPETTRRLRDAGHSWYERIDAARWFVHDTPWAENPVDPDLLRDLVDEGIVAPRTTRSQ